MDDVKNYLQIATTLMVNELVDMEWKFGGAKPSQAKPSQAVLARGRATWRLTLPPRVPLSCPRVPRVPVLSCRSDGVLR